MIHVYPINDTKNHVLEGTGCHCEPRVEIAPGGTIVIHNAYDMREAQEFVNKGVTGEELGRVKKECYEKGDDFTADGGEN